MRRRRSFAVSRQARYTDPCGRIAGFAGQERTTGLPQGTLEHKSQEVQDPMSHRRFSYVTGRLEPLLISIRLMANWFRRNWAQRDSAGLYNRPDAIEVNRFVHVEDRGEWRPPRRRRWDVATTSSKSRNRVAGCRGIH